MSIINQYLNVTNASSEICIYVSFRPSEDANIPSGPSDIVIQPGKNWNFAVQDGTMNMFIWTDYKLHPVWKGVIPTKVKKSVVYIPESNIVLYDGIQIPEGFGPITELPEKQSTSSNKGWWVYFIAALLIVLFFFSVLWYFDKIPKWAITDPKKQ